MPAQAGIQKLHLPMADITSVCSSNNFQLSYSDMSLKNDRLIRALKRQSVDITPIWLMRQAGRYLPEYREIRAKFKDFMTLCKTPELACEVTLQPLRRFDLDAAIIFSDILTIPDAMGLGLYFEEGEGPKFKRPLRRAKEISALKPLEIKELQYVTNAIRLVKSELAGKLPLIGFSGSPWTLATYMVEGGSSKNFAVIKQMLVDQPQILQQLLTLLTEAIVAYLKAQIIAGADAVMIFDTWGGILATTDYQNFSLQYMSQIVSQLKQQVETRTTPIILFTKGGGQWLENMAASGCDAISLDWTVDIGEARRKVGDKVALQGNLDPAILKASPRAIRDAVAKILQSYGSGPGHVFNLGHGITPDIPPEHVNVLVNSVHELSGKSLR